ncbi:MAG TPA: helix-turn-helix domain-containing protein, partial [bacterium]|nr:helix-turn-helix domain-containing protein [bacterium]
IIAITNEPLPAPGERGRILPTLLHRLSAFRIEVPPLRDRVADIVPLCQRLLADRPAAERLVLAPETAEALSAYAWPGNGRELRNVIEGAAWNARDHGVLRPEHLPVPVADAATGTPKGLPARIAALERREIRAAMARTGGNKKRAAELLGVSRKGLIDRLKRLGLWQEYGSGRRRS